MRWPSTTATSSPASPSRPAQTSPAGPAPITITSKSSVIFIARPIPGIVVLPRQALHHAHGLLGVRSALGRVPAPERAEESMLRLRAEILGTHLAGEADGRLYLSEIDAAPLADREVLVEASALLLAE